MQGPVASQSPAAFAWLEAEGKPRGSYRYDAIHSLAQWASMYQATSQQRRSVDAILRAAAKDKDPLLRQRAVEKTAWLRKSDAERAAAAENDRELGLTTP